MDWVSEFFAPLIQVMFIMGFGGAMIFLVARALHKKWTIIWKFQLKYKQVKPSMQDAKLLASLPKETDIFKFKRELLLSGMESNRVNEILYLYNKQIEGEHRVRQIAGSNRKVKAKKFFFFTARGREGGSKAAETS